jgi:molecular chaperone GrpE
MTDSTGRTQDEGAAAFEGSAEEVGQAGGAAASDEATRAAAELKDRLLRTLAEMENLRRRTEREVADARVYGITGLARDLLAVADNLRRAVEALPPQSRQTADAGINALIEGVELTERELLKIFEKNGVKKLEPQGEKFDPNLHQAMFEVADASAPNGVVVQVVQDGYKIGDRVLRPALVGVAKGGPKVASERPANENASPQGPRDAV